MPTKEGVENFFIFAKKALWPVSRAEKKKFKNITRLFFDDDFHAGRVCQHVKRIDD